MGCFYHADLSVSFLFRDFDKAFITMYTWNLEPQLWKYMKKI